MNSVIKYLFIILCFHCSGQNYPKTILLKKDTVIVFSIEQGKRLSLINEERKKCGEELLIVEKQLILKGRVAGTDEEANLKDTIIEGYKDKISSYSEIENTLGKIINEKNDLLGICEDEKDDLKKDIRKQKIQKWIAICSGVVLTFLGLIF